MIQTNSLEPFKKKLFWSFVSTYIWGILAYGYTFFNFTINHDSLMEFDMFGYVPFYHMSAYQVKIAAGRFLTPVYQYVIRGQMTSPWFCGLMGLCWLSLTVFIFSVIFRYNQPFDFVLLSGILTVNISVSCLSATYIHDFDSNMFATFLASCAALAWLQTGKRKFLTLPLLTAAMGIYQSTASITITIAMLISILNLLDGMNWQEVVIDGLKAIGLIACSCILYLLITLCVNRVLQLSLIDNSNGISNLWTVNTSLLSSIRRTYIQWMREMYISGILLNLLIILMLTGIAISALRSNIPTVNKVLSAVLAILLPLGMNISCLLNHGHGHSLMSYAEWLLYLLLYLLCQKFHIFTLKKASFQKHIACTLILLTVFFNVRSSNAMAVKKDMERQATQMLVSRVIDRLEMTDGYVPGETKVYFYGSPSIPEVDGYKTFERHVGLDFTSPVSIPSAFVSYFNLILRYPVNIAGDDVPSDLENRIESSSMGLFPAKDSVQWFGDILVVRFQ